MEHDRQITPRPDLGVKDMLEKAKRKVWTLLQPQRTHI